MDDVLRQTSLQLLEQLILEHHKGTQRQADQLHDFGTGFTVGWFLEMPTPFRDALDCRPTSRTSSQGSSFRFRSGDILYNNMEAYSTGGSASVLVQIKNAETVQLADTTSDKARNPGIIVFDFFTLGNTPLGFGKRATVTTTQDDFVRFAISGPEDRWPEVYDACQKLGLLKPTSRSLRPDSGFST